MQHVYSEQNTRNVYDSLRHIDDKVYYVYERTGLKALSDIMSGRMFNGEELLNLFENIRELLRKMDEYLISPEALYLSEKAVFIDEKTSGLNFV